MLAAGLHTLILKILPLRPYLLLLCPPSLYSNPTDLFLVPRTCPAHVYIQPFAHTIPSAWSSLSLDLHLAGSFSLFRSDWKDHFSKKPSLIILSHISLFRSRSIRPALAHQLLSSQPSSWSEVNLLIGFHIWKMGGNNSTYPPRVVVKNLIDLFIIYLFITCLPLQNVSKAVFAFVNTGFQVLRAGVSLPCVQWVEEQTIERFPFPQTPTLFMVLSHKNLLH